MSSSENPLPPGTVPPPGNYGRGPRGRYREGHPPQHPGYVLNEQERKILQECQRESFWYRAVPFGVLSGTGTYLLIQKGILTTKSRFGPVPKVLFAGFCGYLLGKVSYVSTCKRKFLELGSSPIAEMIRKGASPGAIAAQFGRPRMETGSGDGASDATFAGEGLGRASLGDEYNSEDPSIDTNLDQDISMENYDSSSVGDVPFQPGAEEKVKPEMTMTYDQLRKQNRERRSQQYREVFPGQYQPKSGEPAPQRAPVSSRSSSDDEGFTLGRASKMRKNAYGDLISDE